MQVTPRIVDRISALSPAKAPALSSLARVLLAVAALLAVSAMMPAIAHAVCVADADGDTLCDDVDPCPDDGQDDDDADGVCVGARFNAPMAGASDNCAADPNASQIDSDADGRGDACDLCPMASGAAEDACLTTGFWSGRAPATLARHEGAAAQASGLNFVIGGEQSYAKTVEVYDPVTNTWSTAPPLPLKRHHFQPVVIKNKIYLIGGLTAFPGPSVNTVWMLDVAAPVLGWQVRAPMPTSRGAMGCAADGINIYCAGGLSSTAGNTAIDAFEVYNTVTDTWTTLAPMPRPRDHFQAALVNGRFYAISGRNTAVLAKYAENDIYDIATGTWLPGAPIPTPRGGYAMAVMQGRLIVISGEGKQAPKGTFPEVEEYDPVRDVWRALSPIPTPRHGIGAAVSRVEETGQERAYVATGGPVQGGSKSAVHEVFAYHSAPLICFSPATDPTKVLSGAMTADAQYAAGDDVDSVFDSLSSTLVWANSTTPATNVGADKVTVKVSAALPGNWYLWGRFYYPAAPGSTDGNAFSAKIDSGSVINFGNNKHFFQRWHWDGKGSTQDGPQDGHLVGVLAGGVHTIQIAKREVLPIPPRLDLVCLSQSPVRPTDEAACKAWGGCAPHDPPAPPVPSDDAVCVAAASINPPATFSGGTSTGTLYTSGSDADALLDNLTTPLMFSHSLTNATNSTSDKVIYNVTLPQDGPWYLWGRFYYPGAPNSNDANAFAARLDGGAAKKFGNNNDYFQQWHWGGDGNQVTGTPMAISLGSVTAGAHTITIEKREVVPGPAPRIDLLCVTRDAVTPPTDEQACAILGGEACP